MLARLASAGCIRSTFMWYSAQSHVLLVDDEARTVKLPLPENGQLVAQPAEGIVSWVNRGQFVLCRPGGQKLTFAPLPGVPTRIPLIRLDTTDDNSVWFGYQGGRLEDIATTSGHGLHFEYDQVGRIRNIALRMATGIFEDLSRYQYNADGQLSRVYDAQGNPAVYEYTAGLLTRCTNRLGGSHYLRYDDQRRCVAVWQDGYSHSAPTATIVESVQRW